MTTVDSLSAAMRAEADRPIEPGLGDRARAVLCRTMVSARYRRVSDAAYVAEDSAEEEPEQLTIRYGQITTPSERVLAFHRYRRPVRPGAESEPPLLSHVVHQVAWIDEALAGDPELLGIELAARVADQPKGDTADPRILSLLNMFPIGAIARALGTTGAGVRHLPVGQPPAAESRLDPGRPPPDAEWDLRNDDSESEVPDEELSALVTKTVHEETNDPIKRSPPHPRAPLPPAAGISGNVTLVAQFDEAADGAPSEGIVVGYRQLTSGSFAVVVDPVGADVRSSDPAAQPRVETWQDIDCIVEGIVADHDGPLLQVRRTDGRGRLLVEADRAPGLDGWDRGLGAALRPGAVLSVGVWPTVGGSPAASVLPALRAHLDTASPEVRQVQGDTLELLGAEVVQAANRWGQLVVELDHTDADRGLRHRLQAHRQQFATAGMLAPEIGDRVLVALKPDRSRYRRSLPLPTDAAVSFAKGAGATLIVDGRAAR